MMVFEFKDNPLDRFVLPKESVIEVLNSGDILVSFLAIHKPPEPDTKKDKKKAGVKKDDPKTKTPVKAKDTPASTPAKVGEATPAKASEGTPSTPVTTRSADKKDEPPVVYTPTTITIRDLPEKHIPVVARCVNKYERVVKRMEEVLKNGKRTAKWSVWYQLPESEEELVELLHRVPPGPLDAIPPKRTYKPRQKKDPIEPSAKKAKVEVNGTANAGVVPGTGAGAPTGASTGTTTGAATGTTTEAATGTTTGATAGASTGAAAESTTGAPTGAVIPSSANDKPAEAKPEGAATGDSTEPGTAKTVTFADKPESMDKEAAKDTPSDKVSSVSDHEAKSDDTKASDKPTESADSKSDEKLGGTDTKPDHDTMDVDDESKPDATSNTTQTKAEQDTTA